MAAGEIVSESFDSDVLKGNPLGDPTKRDITIYLPPKYDPNHRYPAAYAIVGYTGTGKSLLSVDPLGEDLKAKLDRLIRTGKMGPMIVPMVDCFSKVGGNQYINSTATGRYDDYLRKEIVPFVESKYRISRRGIWGKSSDRTASRRSAEISTSTRRPPAATTTTCERKSYPSLSRSIGFHVAESGASPQIGLLLEGRRKSVHQLDGHRPLRRLPAKGNRTLR